MLKYTGYRGEVRVGWISQGILLSQSSQPQRLLPSDSMTFSQDKTQVTENPSVVPRGFRVGEDDWKPETQRALDPLGVLKFNVLSAFNSFGTWKRLILIICIFKLLGDF